MKKIFILPILIAPIMAHATDPVGPAHVNSGAVVATANAPYAIATPETGDTTNVVSASYVKGAYNDAISAINNVANKVSSIEGNVNGLFEIVNNDIEDEIAEKQDKIFKLAQGTEMAGSAVDEAVMDDAIRNATTRTTNNGYVYYYYGVPEFDDYFVTAGAVLTAFKDHTVKAVTTWGNDTNTTNLSLTPTNR